MAITNGNVGTGQTVDVLTVSAGKSYRSLRVNNKHRNRRPNRWTGQ